MRQVYAVGETVLDIIFRGNQPRAAKPGGSSFNASITLGRLGVPITFISEMGQDRVGDIIQEFLDENGVNSNSISRYDTGQSAIALAFLNDNSDAEYQFFKDYPHQRLNVEFPDIQPDDLLVFGSFYALNPGIRPRITALLEKAQQAGATIMYDPNFRSSHLHEREKLRQAIEENMSYASIVRASDEDLINIFEVDNPEEAWDKVSKFCPLLLYTANAGGVYLKSEHLSFHMKVESIEPLSTIGAGDTFNAGILYGLSRKGYTREQVRTLGQQHWEELIRDAISFSREVCLSYDNYLPIGIANNYKNRDIHEKKNIG